MSIDTWPTSVWIAAALGPPAAHLLYGFIRQGWRHSGIAVATAFLAHLGLSRLVPDAPSTVDRARHVMEIELLEPEPPPKPPAPNVEPVLEPAELELDPKPEHREPKPPVRRPLRAKPRKTRKSEPRPSNVPVREPPGPKRFDLSQLNPSGDSGVSVHHGTGGGPTLDSDAHHRGKGGKGDRGDTAQGPKTDPGTSRGTGPTWDPASQVVIRRFPTPRSIPKRECPATKDGIQGTVFLKVQIRRDGTVRQVKLVKGIGHGCDAIAITALKKAKFRPAKSNANRSVDSEIRYEYAFRLAQ